MTAHAADRRPGPGPDEQAAAAVERYLETRDPAELAVAADAWERAAAAADDPEDARVCRLLAATTRSHHLLESADPDETAVRRAATALVAAAEHLPDEDPERAAAAVTLAQLRILAHHLAGGRGTADLDVAISMLTGVLTVDLPDTERYAALAGLVDAYAARSAVTGDRADAEARIRALRDLHRMPAVGSAPPGFVAAELGLALAGRTPGPDGTVEDLDEIVDRLAEADAELAADAPVRPLVRRTLGLHRWLRSTNTRRPDDADAALPLLEEVLRGGPDTQVALAAVQLLLARAVPAGAAPTMTAAELGRLVRDSDLTAGRAQAARAVELLAAVLADPAVDGEVRAYASGQLAAAMLFADPGGLPTDQLTVAADHLERAYGGMPAQPEFLVQLGLVRAQLARRHGNPEAELRVAIDLLSRAEGQLPTQHALRPNALVARAYALVPLAARTQTRDDVQGTMQALEAAAVAVPPDDPVRADLLGQLGIVSMVAMGHGAVAGGLDRVIELMRAALAVPPADPRRQAELVNGLADALSGRYQERGADADADEAVDCYARARDLLPPGDPFRIPVRVGLATLLGARYDHRRDLRDLDTSIEMLDGLAADVAGLDVAHVDAVVRALRGSALLLRAERAVDPTDATRFDRAEDDLTAAAGALPSGHVAVPLVRSDLALVRLLTAVDAEDETALRVAVDALITAGRAVPAGHPHRPGLLARGGQALLVHAARIGDVASLDEGISWVTEAIATTGPENRPLLHMGLGEGLLHRHRLLRRAADLDRAVDELRAGWDEVAGSPGHPVAAMAAMALARALRRRSEGTDVGEADDRAADARIAYARRVLLQTGTARALAVARGAAAETLWSVRWHLADGRPDAAVAALEAGRGLVLHAAVAEAGVADLLGTAGQDALAARWRIEAGTEPDEASADLRHRVLAALDRIPAAHRLLAPPTVAELATGVATVGADALVYLLPAPDPWDPYLSDGAPLPGGAALTVDRAGVVRAVPLPGLRLGADTPLGADPEARPASEPADLGRLADWAWEVAMGPVLDHLHSLVPGRLPRAVLVPVGALGSVPWHAARRGPGDHALAHAVLSYAAGGRQLVDLAANPGPPADAGSALVVNPDGSLLAASLAGPAMRARFFPDADYLGQPVSVASGRGTAAEVLARLPGGMRPAAFLELDCHAKAGPTPAESYLLLADGPLTVDRVLRSAAGRSGGGLVLLSACESDLTLREYDEALTVASAFLTAGATGVLGTGWPIDDQYAPLVMFRFHQERAAGATPADALRATQLWLLDPDRTAPPGLPQILERYVSRPELTDPAVWAAYNYRGR